MSWLQMFVALVQPWSVYYEMALTFQVDKAHGVIRSRGTGVLTMDELLKYFAESRADPDFHPSMHRVMDLRDVKQLPSSEDIRSLAAFARTKAPVETARMAIITSSDLAFGVSMMFKAFVGYGERLIIVQDHEEAMQWLTTGRPPD